VIFRRQVLKISQETPGRLLIEDGVVVITNEKLAVFTNTVHPGRKTAYRDTGFSSARTGSASGQYARWPLVIHVIRIPDE
jgi:hypothetical protein